MTLQWMPSLTLLVGVSLIVGACKTPVDPGTSAVEPTSTEPAEAVMPKPAAIVGNTSPDAIIGMFEAWSPEAAVQPDATASAALSAVDAGATVEVYLGTWCSDSRREVPRLWRALDLAGTVPFDVRYIGLDRDFAAADVNLDDKDIIAVPTFVVLRNGVEVGRVIEESPTGIESDLLSLLDGSKTGNLSASR